MAIPEKYVEIASVQPSRLPTSNSSARRRVGFVRGYSGRNMAGQIGGGYKTRV
jgi:hypothetical protein